MGQTFGGIAQLQSQTLHDGWEVLSSPPGAYGSPAQLPAGDDWLPTTVPCTAAGTLRAAGRWSLDGPARRFDAEDWWYRLRFTAEPAVPGSEPVLCFDGLATLAQVWLNDSLILSTDNMFSSHEVGIAGVLQEHNELVLCCRSLDEALQRRRPRPRWRAPMIEHQQLRWLRTTLLGRTPGWSPPAAVVGPWKPIRLEWRPGAAVHRTSLRATVVDGVGELTFEARLPPAQLAAQIELRIARGGSTHSVKVVDRDAATCRATLRVPDPDLWWPHTHGEPALYDVTLHIESAGTAQMPLDLGRIGFRSITLDRSEGGFALAVNGVNVFCRGACWMPLDAVTLCSTSADYRRALTQVTAAGMNMLRIPGTTVYESDEFHDQCDALGILVWQDYMFANMDYPEDDGDFSACVDAEVRQTLARLQRHPSVAVLCGNSEVEQQAAMWGTKRDLWQPRLFHTTLAQLSQDLCPDAIYWPSSAHGGAFPHEPASGTCSYYGVGAYQRHPDDARRSQLRFATECLAFANVPEQSTIARMPGGSALRVHHPGWKARSPRDLGAGWDFDDVRDHYLAHHFAVDPQALRYADHARYLALSRRISGIVMAQAYGEWRRSGSSCHGALVLSLHDLWPGAGWGVIGSDGVPKAAYHSLLRALQPRSLHLSDEGMNGVSVHLTNEGAEPLSGALDIVLFRHGEIEVARAGRAVHVAARARKSIPAAELFDEFHDLSYSHRFGPAQADLIVATLIPDDGGPPLQAFFMLDRFCTPTELGLEAAAVAQADGVYHLLLSTRVFAHSIAIDCEGYDCDLQYFDLAPGGTRTVVLRPASAGAARPTGDVTALNSRQPTRIAVRS